MTEPDATGLSPAAVGPHQAPSHAGQVVRRVLLRRNIVIDAITSTAGLDDHVTSHVLRHTFGTELTRSGTELVTVAELMGHASLETTRLYTRPSEADMQRAVDLLTADE